MGGKGSGSVPGKNASNFRDGRWLNVDKLRKKAKHMGKNLVVDHITPVQRGKNYNQVNHDERLQRPENLRIVSKSFNTKKGGRKR